jgi:hypothetical protein
MSISIHNSTLLLDNVIYNYACFTGNILVNGKTYTIQAEDLPELYDVPFKECLFVKTIQKWNKSPDTCINQHNCIILTPLANGNYKKHLCILKLKKLLEGNTNGL